MKQWPDTRKYVAKFPSLAKDLILEKYSYLVLLVIILTTPPPPNFFAAIYFTNIYYTLRTYTPIRLCEEGILYIFRRIAFTKCQQLLLSLYTAVLKANNCDFLKIFLVFLLIFFFIALKSISRFKPV